MSWLHAARTRARLLFGERAAEARMDEEMRFHVEMEAERLARDEGLDPGEARRRALVAFGGVERYREEMREGRGFAWLSGLSLDFKLGFRMLVKYPGLTVVGVLAMAFAIWAGVVTFVFVGQFMYPTLPLPGGDRVVQLYNWDVAENEKEPRALYDFESWRGLRSVTDLGAYQDVSANLMVGREAGRLLRGAAVTASAFRIAPEAPMLGRALTPADERPDAPLVVVIGHEVWRTRFAGDPGVVGRTVRLGELDATVVGVMPEGFAFPVSHELWTPLRVQSSAFAPREGPPIKAFARLAPGVSMEQAQAELTAIGARTTAAQPATHQHLRPRLAPYAQAGGENQDDLVAFLSIDAFAVMLLVLICSNLALLLFARAATRETELVVRSALGASRGRIMAQLFAEALVLGAVSALIGLAMAQVALRVWGVEFLTRNLGALPFWIDLNVSAATVLYAALLTLLGAGIAGLIPAQKVTRGLGSRLKQGTAGSGLRFGGIWTAVIIAQVAVTVAIPAIAYVQRQEAVRVRTYDVGFASGQYLGVRLVMEPGADTAAHRTRFVSALEALRRRVAAEPGVTGVTFVDRLPRDSHRYVGLELDDPATPGGRTALAEPEASTARIDPSYFEVLRTPVLAGRGFTPADLGPDARVVIVDQRFVDRMLQGRNPVGRRIRLAPYGEKQPNPARPWYEIVGVVKDLGMGFVFNRELPAGVYLPAVPGQDGLPVEMMVHTGADPISMGPRIRELAASVDATLQIPEVRPVDEISDSALWLITLWLNLTLVLTGIALLLSLAGIYSVLSFTVARRTREIGVRVALGASRGRVVAEIFRRPLTQVATGVVVGILLVALGTLVLTGHQPDTEFSLHWDLITFEQVTLLVVHAATMIGVCLLACVVPTQRALGVQPTEALRAE